MAVVALGTHAVVKELTAAGSTDEQAEAVTRVVTRAFDIDLSNLATKLDLAVFATKTDLADSKTDILTWTIGTIGVQTAVIVGAVVALACMIAH